MTDRSVIFPAREVLAALDGRKTQFRRPMVPQPIAYQPTVEDSDFAGVAWSDSGT